MINPKTDLMDNLRDNIGQGFFRIAGAIYRRPLLSLVVVLLITGALSGGMVLLKLDTSYSGFLEDDDPALIEYRSFRRQFGRNTVLFVVVEPEKVFDLGFLKRLENLHRDLEAGVPDLDEITSLVNVRTTRSEGDLLIVEGLGKSWPDRDENLPSFKARVLGDPLYRNQIISGDGSLTALILKINTADPTLGEKSGSASSGSGPENIKETMEQGFRDRPEPEEEQSLLTDRGNRPAFKAVQTILADYRAPDMKIYLAGALAVTETLKNHLKRDLFFLIRTALAVIGGCLLITWLRFTGVFGPLLVVVSALTSTLGLMGYLGVDLKLPTLILPTIVLAAGVGDSIHVLALFFQEYGKRGNKMEALLGAFRRSGPALLFTTLTTAAGLISFAASRVTPISELAVTAAAGIILAMIFTVLLLPAVIALIPLKPAGPDLLPSLGFLKRVIPGIARLTTTRPRTVLVVCGFILVGSLAGLQGLNFSHDILAWMPLTSQIRQDHLVVDERMGGTIFIETVIDAKRPDGFHSPGLLKGLDDFTDELKKSPPGNSPGENPPVGRSFSLADLVKETHQALNEGLPQNPPIPDNRKLISQELLLFEAAGGEYLKSLVDHRYRLGRLSLTVPTRDALAYPPFLDRLNDSLNGYLGDRGSAVWTGTAALISRTVLEAIRSIPLGYTTALIMITVFMILLLGRIRLGLLCMIPNLFPIITVLGLMGWLGLPLDMSTMLFVTIAGGLAVDDTVHFMHHYRAGRAAGAGVGRAVEETLSTAGRAMIVTSLVLGLGFLTCGLASLRNLYFFGIMSGLSIFLAVAADFFICPALMAMLEKSGKRRVGRLRPG